VQRWTPDTFKNSRLEGMGVRGMMLGLLILPQRLFMCSRVITGLEKRPAGIQDGLFSVCHGS